MKAALFFFVFLFSFSLTLAYAGLPAIVDDPGEPDFPVSVVPSPVEEGDAAGGGGFGGGLNGTLPLPEENGSLPEITAVPTELVIDPETGELVVLDEQDSSATSIFDPVTGDDSLISSSLVFPMIGFALVIALLVFLLVVRKKHKSKDLPERIKKF